MGFAQIGTRWPQGRWTRSHVRMLALCRRFSASKLSAGVQPKDLGVRKDSCLCQ